MKVVFYSKEQFWSLKIDVEALYPNIFCSQVLFLCRKALLGNQNQIFQSKNILIVKEEKNGKNLFYLSLWIKFHTENFR